MFDLTHNDIKKAIIRSQHCQRNWDLSKDMPEDDINLLIAAATQCPSKQNVSYYKAHFITNRDLIELIHAETEGFTMTHMVTTNSQVLANLLVILEKNEPKIEKKFRNEEWSKIRSNVPSESDISKIEKDRNMAIGIAAGYLNMTATLLGYSTGCCACFNTSRIKEILDLEFNPSLLMGIGHKNRNLNRRIHHLNHEIMFPTKEKQEIFVKVWN